jgi:catechol 2,3-dioxygenase-like lactoylglutathione lyase family enzyme
LSVPYGVRVSRIYEAGGELVYGFGYFDVRSPSGYAVRARVAARRDPMELVALNVPDVAASAAFFETAFGMRASTPLDQNGYAPKSPPGSRLMTFGEVKETLGILLQPSQALEDPEAARKRGEAFAGVRFVVGGGETAVADAEARAAAVGNDSQPCAVSAEGYEAWEADVARGARALPFKYNEPPPVAEN